MLILSKREKFVIATLFLFSGLFISQNLSASPRIVLVLILSVLSPLFLFFILYPDLKENLSVGLANLFILPIFFTLAFGFFYFLLPERFLTRIVLSSFFGIGIYALYLSHNIFIVATSKTIALVNAARSVAFLLTVLTHFFLSNVIFSLHLAPPLLTFLSLLISFFLILGTLGRIREAVILSLVIGEIALMLNFWPANPTVAALFLSGNFYTFVGLYQAWLERRLFKNTLWEYILVSIIVFLVLLRWTKWGG